MSIVVSFQHRKNENTTIHGDMVTIATLTDGTEHVVDNWYSDERQSHLLYYHGPVMPSLEFIKGYVHDKDVEYIKNWV
jgi:hypothetical protein